MDRDARILAEVAARRDLAVETAQELVRVPTMNPPGACYREVCELFAARLERLGWSVELLRAEGSPGDSDAFPRWNLVARAEGAGPGPCVHFNGHHDVVEPGHGWTRDPFAAELSEGRIWGRGAADMKGGIAAALAAAEGFRAACPDFRGAIEISATADEESGGYGGVAWLAAQGRFDPARVAAVIIPEPLGTDRVCLGHRGVWWAEIETRGRIAHGAMPFLGRSAIDDMGAVLHALETRLRPALAARRTAMPVIPEGARAATLNLNAIHGGAPDQGPGATGLPAPCVADRCRLVLDRRVLVEEDMAAVKAEVAALLAELARERPGLDWSLRDLFEVAPVLCPADAPVAAATAAAIARVLGRKAAFVASPGTYDQKHIDRIGRLRNCIAYGPGRLELAHQPDEWVAVDEIMDAAAVMALALAALLG